MTTTNHHEMQRDAARELLATTKRNLQLVDEQLSILQEGRSAVELASDVSSEHRTSWLGAVDAEDGLNGIRVGSTVLFGLGNPFTGMIRNQEDAAFVCTNIMVIWSTERAGQPKVKTFAEDVSDNLRNLALRLTDSNSGRSLITGMTEGPKDLDRGVVAFSYLSSIRVGLGANTKNKLFSEFTIPRAGVVRAEVFNLSKPNSLVVRAWVSLFGYKVYGA